MAKPENPAEAPVHARPPRLVQRVRLEASPEAPLVAQRAEQAMAAEQAMSAEQAMAAEHRGSHVHRAMSERDEAFDTTRNLEAPEMLADDDLRDDIDDATQFDVEEVVIEEVADPEGGAYFEAAQSVPVHRDAGYPSEGEPSAGDPNLGYPDVEPRPGLAWALPGSASASRAPRVPVANLERPSTSRVELTPSPVPRVALAPATGAVDISLVPGPHSVGSRNLPTLAAQHLIGRRQRRPAPAVTVPPGAAPSREAGAAFALARDVRSSKGEIVLGLTIGLGVSLLLAGLGQAYMRGDVVADQPESALESVTLSARPEAAVQATGSGATSSGAVASPSGAAASEDKTPAQPAVSASIRAGASSPIQRGDVSFGGATRGDDSDLLARTVFPGDSERAPKRARAVASRAVPSRAVPSRSVPSRAVSSHRATPSEPTGIPVEAAALSPAVLAPTVLSPAAVSPERARAPSAPLTPAQSAGLGLDLPL